MKIQIKCLFYLILILSFSSHATEKIGRGSLLEFSQANCLFWYFKEKGYETEDIKNISSGIVSLSHLSPDKFRETAFLVKNYAPSVSTKKNIDPNLNKCFYMVKDKLFIEKLNNIYER